ncbi:MAG: YdcF family protein [Anaerolineales bacterium]|nr:YdcF family protein [Anaerolineales bacterium]
MKAASIRNIILLCLSLLLLLFAPQTWLKIKYKDSIYGQIDSVPPQDSAVVFGAWVNEDHSLSDVTRERVETGIQLYKSGKVKRLFLSGDNRSNRQAESMANYAVTHGVKPNDIITDKLGIDTNDTCKHFAKIGRKAVLVTQGYHLPRTMLMCAASEIDVTGLAADKLGILSSRGDGWLQIHMIRAWRSTREAALTWSFLVGIYDRLSTEAETLERIE